jgi:RNA polymerase sigma-70 factor (ECF subfamily)
MLTLEAPVDQATDTHDVVVRYQDMVYGIAVTHTASKADADDVFQEVFLTYHRKQPDLNDDDHRKAWLITTTLNCARRAATSSWRTRVVPLAPAEAERVRPEPFHFATEDQDAIFRALQAVPAGYREVIHLFYFEDLPVARIAALLGLEEGAVKMRLSRGRALLRDLLKDQGGYFHD